MDHEKILEITSKLEVDIERSVWEAIGSLPKGACLSSVHIDISRLESIGGTNETIFTGVRATVEI